MTIFGFDILTLFSIGNLLAILLGTTVGLIFGALPGLGAIMAMIVLLPLTYSMEPVAAVLLLLSAFQAAEYGGSISSIALGIPGTPAAAATILDGSAMAKKGYPGKALGYSLTASTIGAFAGGLALIFLAQPFAKFALKLSEPEYFLIGILGLIAVSMISSKNAIKGLISMMLGLMIGTIGMDMFTGEQRFTMGQAELLEGVGILPILVGVFAFPEIFKLINLELRKVHDVGKQNLNTKITLRELRDVSQSTIIGSILGVVLGILPGLGAVSASWFSYVVAQKTSKTPEKFGTGHPEGIAAPESANNATVASSMIPLLALGIPGSVAPAIIMGAFIIHGVQPGPRIFQNNSDLVYGILFGILLSTVAMYVMGRYVTSLFARALILPNPILVPFIYLITIIGVFAANGLFFDLWVALLIGVICYLLIEAKFSMPTLIIAFVLAPIIEESFRRALIISNGDFSIFYTRIYSIILLVLIALIIIVPNINKYRNKKKTSLNI
ncbi:C4-dicarboxylate ABC transporter permease [Sporosarcina sp. PTS2304]|uniref:tripartite tricarboxylate transporter permease n=1 Tax=Sporosarcina sp. PTS2304 TaxID=2283194 RepID=UPI000E0D28E0|nr:tripartite tricarboxylate transporter permease [Sporosarcina sp. PTS2304]AXH99546.1 C4-dicarboxylate ABC transporter permease [Sporosarcina sp. PTS2304]